MDNSTEFGISFCTGYGGIERGLEIAGLKHRIVANVEIEAYAIANLVAKMEQGHLVPAPVWTNLKTFPMEAFRGRVDFITAGYPCQPFSCAGQRKGTEDQRHLWPHLRRIYQTIRPRWMLFENVEGHVTLGLSTVISDLEEDGYRTTWGLFTAAEVGAPHRRKRVFILAHSNSQRKRAGCGEVCQENGEVPERNDDAEFVEPSKEMDDSRRIRQAVGCMQTAWFEQSGEGSMEDSHGVGRGGRSEGGDEVRGCGVSEDKTTGPGSSSEVMADTISQGRERVQQRGTYNRSDGEQERAHGSASECRPCKWPARPGEPQHDWEEPRTVESFVGNTVDGPSERVGKTSWRVDELRLLGNGVVPQQAARAYKILTERMKS